MRWPLQIGPSVRALLGRALLPGSRLSVPTETFGAGLGARTLCPRGLEAGSVVYSFGIGRDLSFEQALVDRFGALVHAFDPTPRSISWLQAQSLPAAIAWHAVGLADFDGEADFVPPSDPNFVSFSMARPSRPARDAVTLPVRRLASVKRQLGHDRIDLLKLDIEGAEYAALDDLIAADLDIPQILVEFHHRLPGFRLSDTLGALGRLRRSGYRIFHATPRRDDFGLLRP